MKEPASSSVTVTHRYRVKDLSEVLRDITSTKQTGSLVIHFSQGARSALEWQEKVNTDK